MIFRMMAKAISAAMTPIPIATNQLPESSNTHPHAYKLSVIVSLPAAILIEPPQDGLDLFVDVQPSHWEGCSQCLTGRKNPNLFWT